MHTRSRASSRRLTRSRHRSQFPSARLISNESRRRHARHGVIRLRQMNEIFFPAPERPTTQAAEGLPRWCWAVAEIEKLAAAGFFRENERFELVGGEIVPMSPKGIRHEIIREELAFRF